MSTVAHTGLQLFLGRLNARSVLGAAEQRAILDLPTQVVEVGAKQDFTRVREATSYSCLVASGLVGRFGQTRDGARQITAFHLPGDMADLQSAVRPISVGGLTALTEATILRVPHAAVLELAARFPTVAEAFWGDCALDAAILMQWVVNVGRRDARTRLAHMFCEMAIRLGAVRKPDLSYSLPITQEQLGDATAMTGVHVNRSLRALRELKLATFKAGHVEIHDWNALKKIGEFDPAYLVTNTSPDEGHYLISAGRGRCVGVHGKDNAGGGDLVFAS